MNARKHILYCLATASLVLAAAAGPQSAHAQAATNLKCRGCVGGGDIGKKAIRSKHIKPNAVDSAAIKDGSVSPADLAANAKPSGAAHAEEAGLDVDLGAALDDIVSITLNAPSSGFAFVIANWTWNTFTASSSASCYLEDTPDTGGLKYAYSEADVGDSTHYSGGSITQLFPVAAGANTFYLNCKKNGGNMAVSQPQISALFVPNQY